MDVAVHLRCPLQEAPQAGSLRPQKFPEFQESNLGHFDAGESLDPRQEIGTAPGGNPVATGGVPKKAQHRRHRVPVERRDRAPQAADKVELRWAPNLYVETRLAASLETGQAPSLQTHEPTSYFVISTLARVVSHSRRSVHLLPAGSKAMVKFSTGEAVFETCMSTRANSSASYLYGMPHSAFFLLIISVHLSAFGMVKMV